MRLMKLLALMTILTLAAVACGGDNDITPRAGGTTSPGGTSPQPTANSPLNNQGTMDATAMSKFSLELDDQYFKPTFIKATSGQTFNIELENEGTLPHTFTITALNFDREVAPGTTEEIDLTLPSGTSDVAFFCRFHASAGMRGAFFFGGAPSGLSTPPEQDPY